MVDHPAQRGILARSRPIGRGAKRARANRHGPLVVRAANGLGLPHQLALTDDRSDDALQIVDRSELDGDLSLGPAEIHP